MIMKKTLVTSLLFAVLVLSLPAVEISFDGLDLMDNELLLFRSSVFQPGWGAYDALFLANLAAKDSITALTFCPERIEWLPSMGQLQIQNRFGIYRMDLEESTPWSLDFVSSFANKEVIRVGRILPVATSPDGRWIVIQESSGSITATLALYEVETGRRLVVTEDFLLEYQDTPVLWSPDSQFFLYAKEGKLYYLAIRHIEEGRWPAEEYRSFGKGSLQNVRWAQSDTLYYIEDTLVNRIRSSEFYTRSFYSTPVRPGNTEGTLPIGMDSYSDFFWPAPDGSAIILLKDDRSLFYFPLRGTKKGTGMGTSLPFLLLPRGQTILQIWWRSSGQVFLLAGDRREGRGSTQVYYLENRENAQFKAVGIEGEVRRFSPSPDETQVAWLTAEGVSILDARNLDMVDTWEHPDPREIFWLADERILIAGGDKIEIVELKSRKAELLTLSRPGKAGFNAAGRFQTLLGGKLYERDGIHGRWVEGGVFSPRPVRTESLMHRVYLEEVPSSSYNNRIMVRTIAGYGTRSLFAIPEPELEDYPGPGDEILPSYLDDRIFDHGLRQGRREVSLIFDAIDSDEGLDTVLSILADYGLKVTFFMGGDFIRRHPDAVQLLADSPHEIGSLFYTHMDMTDLRYRIDKDFVIRGLARNEDDYFRVTGKEVSTLWHAPWYVISPPILDASQGMSYLYVGRDMDTLDWVTLDVLGTRDLYEEAPELVRRILRMKKPGSIIPIRIGKAGYRHDYLFQQLELLINSLLEQGYHIVPINILREHAR